MTSAEREQIIFATVSALPVLLVDSPNVAPEPIFGMGAKRRDYHDPKSRGPTSPRPVAV